MPDSEEMLEEALKKSLLTELGDTKDKRLIPAIVQGAKSNSFNNLKTGNVRWPGVLRDYARTEYRGACWRLVPEDKAVFRINEETGDVPFKKKIFGVDGKVISLKHWKSIMLVRSKHESKIFHVDFHRHP